MRLLPVTPLISNTDIIITSSENWQPFLRRAYLRRSPERTPFPPEAADEGSEWDWFSLDPPAKIDSLHCLLEWFFQNPERVRVRHLMRDDDEHAHWRLEPIGYDEDRDAYWYFGGEYFAQQCFAFGLINVYRRQAMGSAPVGPTIASSNKRGQAQTRREGRTAGQ